MTSKVAHVYQFLSPSLTHPCSRREKMEAGIRYAISVPLSLMRIAHSCWPHLLTLATHGNIQTMCDLQVSPKGYVHLVKNKCKNIFIWKIEGCINGWKWSRKQEHRCSKTGDMCMHSAPSHIFGCTHVICIPCLAVFMLPRFCTLASLHPSTFNL